MSRKIMNTTKCLKEFSGKKSALHVFIVSNILWTAVRWKVENATCSRNFSKAYRKANKEKKRS